MKQIEVLFFSTLSHGLHTLPLPGTHAMVETSQTDRKADQSAILDTALLVAHFRRYIIPHPT